MKFYSVSVFVLFFFAWFPVLSCLLLYCLATNIWNLDDGNRSSTENCCRIFQVFVVFNVQVYWNAFVCFESAFCNSGTVIQTHAWSVIKKINFESPKSYAGPLGHDHQFIWIRMLCIKDDRVAIRRQKTSSP